MNYEKIRDEILNFRDQRDWKQFHNPKDLAIAISIEAGELEEIFLWKSQEESYKIWREDTRVREEFSDIFNFMVLFAEECGIDIEKEVLDKLKKMEKNIHLKTLKVNLINIQNFNFYQKVNANKTCNISSDTGTVSWWCWS